MGASDVVTLSEVDAEMLDGGVNLFIGDVFSDGFFVEKVRDVIDRADDRLIEGFGVDGADEAAIDFNKLNRDIAEIGQRRKSATEVIERKADAEGLEFADEIDGEVEIGDKGGFGDFESEARWADVAHFHLFYNITFDIGIADGLSGEVDAHFNLGSNAEIKECELEYMEVDLIHAAKTVGSGEEDSWGSP